MNLVKAFLFTLVAFVSIAPAVSMAGSCPLCEQTREYRRLHPELNYEYYEDYLKDQAAKTQAQPQE